MNKEIIKELLEKLKQCDDFHNRCDFLMEHSEITYMLDYITNLQQENQKLKDNWNELKKELKDKFEEFRYVEDECLRTMAQEDDSILFSMKCIEKGGINE